MIESLWCVRGGLKKSAGSSQEREHQVIGIICVQFLLNSFIYVQISFWPTPEPSRPSRFQAMAFSQVRRRHIKFWLELIALNGSQNQPSTFKHRTESFLVAGTHRWLTFCQFCSAPFAFWPCLPSSSLPAWLPVNGNHCSRIPHRWQEDVPFPSDSRRWSRDGEPLPPPAWKKGNHLGAKHVGGSFRRAEDLPVSGASLAGWRWGGGGRGGEAQCCRCKSNAASPYNEDLPAGDWHRRAPTELGPQPMEPTGSTAARRSTALTPWYLSLMKSFCWLGDILARSPGQAPPDRNSIWPPPR